MKYLHHIIIPRTSDMLTSSDYVEVATCIFCFLEIFTIAPFPIDIMAPVCPFESHCTPKYPSTHQTTLLSESDLRYRFMYSVPLKYIRPCLNFPQPSTSGSLTLVVRKYTRVLTSDLALLHRNKVEPWFGGIASPFPQSGSPYPHCLESWINYHQRDRL